MRILTIDLEEWFHLLGWPPVATPAQWSSFETRIERATDRIISLLLEHDVKATFFCLGWVAERWPHLIRRIDQLGHEIASHGHEHQLLNRQSPAEFEVDLVRSLHALGDITGKPVTAYRAPGFSLTRDTIWALDALARNGIEVDCSIFPGRRAHGGFRDGGCVPSWLRWDGGMIRELPVPPGRMAGAALHYSGGGYFRLTPYPVTRRLLSQSAYAMTYFHPRDFDPQQPRFRGMGPIRHFRSYVGLGSALTKLDRMLRDFTFTTVQAAVAAIDWDDAPVMDIAPRPAVARSMPATPPLGGLSS